jgi:ribokinase
VLAAGGKGANQAVAAARMGAKVTFVAKVGGDMFGDQAVAGYQKEGIATDFIFRDADHATGVALILVDAHGENLISVASGANGFLTPADIEKAEAVIAGADVVATQLETPLDVLACTAKLAKKHGVPLILDPAPAPDEPLPVEILRDVTCIKPNENETERLTGIRVTDVASAQNAADRLLELGIKAAVITLGNDGCLLVEAPGKGIHVPGYKVEAIDTTAAGDAFSGALACGFGEGRPLHEAVRIANAVAALSVTRLGAQPSLPTKLDVDAFLK